MAAIGDGSVRNLAASVAHSITAGESAVRLNPADLQQPPPVGDSIQKAFQSLILGSRNEASRGAPQALGSIEPFTSPPVPADRMMGILKEAINAFREIAGIKWNIGSPMQATGLDLEKQRSSAPFDAQRIGLPLEMQKAGSFLDKQHIDLDHAQQMLGGTPTMQRAGPEAEKQSIGAFPDKQHTGMVFDKQVVVPNSMQRELPESGQQKVGEFPGQQHVALNYDQQMIAGTPTMQRAGPEAEKQSIGAFPDKQHVGMVFDQQVVVPMSMQREMPESGQQKVGEFPGQQRVGLTYDQQTIVGTPTMQRAGPEAEKQSIGVLPDKQHIGMVFDQQVVVPISMQRELPESGQHPGAADTPKTGLDLGVRSLDDTNRLFGLLNVIVTGDNDITSKLNQKVR